MHLYVGGLNEIRKGAMMKLSSTYFGVLIFLLGGLSVVGAAPVTYSYSGPDLTDNGSSLYTGQSITGSFTVEELAPLGGWTDLSSALPAFSFSDGVRTITNADIVAGPGDITDASQFYIQEFGVETDASGDIYRWSIWFINSSLTNSLRTGLNGIGSDATRITPGLSGCGAGSWSYCGGTVSTSTSGTVGAWTASIVPIPAAAWLFGSALAGLGWMRRK
jgi:hypothetical protein